MPLFILFKLKKLSGRVSGFKQKCQPRAHEAKIRANLNQFTLWVILHMEFSGLVGPFVKCSSFACPGLKPCKELCVKSASEAKVTSSIQSERISVEECEGLTRVIFFTNTRAEKNVKRSKLDSNLDLIQSKLTLFVITTTLIECLIYARFSTVHLTFIDPFILLMILQSRFYYLLYLIENERKEQRFINVSSLQDSKVQD